jgi:hypothetical protein
VKETLSAKDEVVLSHEAELFQLRQSVAEERQRVVNIAMLLEPFDNFVSTILGSTSKKLPRQQHYDHPHEQAEVKSYVDYFQSYQELVLRWILQGAIKCGELSLSLNSTDTSIESYLPDISSHTLIQSYTSSYPYRIPDFADGLVLVRFVIYLIISMNQEQMSHNLHTPTATVTKPEAVMLEEPPSRRRLRSSIRGTNDLTSPTQRASMNNRKSISIDQLSLLHMYCQDPNKNQREIINFLMNLMRQILKIPNLEKIDTDAFLNGHIPTITSLLVMLIEHCMSSDTNTSSGPTSKLCSLGHRSGILAYLMMTIQQESMKFNELSSMANTMVKKTIQIDFKVPSVVAISANATPKQRINAELTSPKRSRAFFSMSRSNSITANSALLTHRSPPGLDPSSLIRNLTNRPESPMRTTREPIIAEDKDYAEYPQLAIPQGRRSVVSTPSHQIRSRFASPRESVSFSHANNGTSTATMKTFDTTAYQSLVDAVDRYFHDKGSYLHGSAYHQLQVLLHALEDLLAVQAQS